MRIHRTWAALLVGGTLLCSRFVAGDVAAQNRVGLPRTNVHFAAVKFKPGVSETEKRSDFDGLRELADRIPGVKNIWLQAVSVDPKHVLTDRSPGDWTHANAIEFEDPAGDNNYGSSPLHEAWSESHEDSRSASFTMHVHNPGSYAPNPALAGDIQRRLFRLFFLTAPPSPKHKEGFAQPKTVIRAVMVRWKPGQSEADKQQLLSGIIDMAGKIQGIKNVWTETSFFNDHNLPSLAEPNNFHDVYAIEFQDRAAALAYEKHPAYQAWVKSETRLCAATVTIDVTNP